jgi:hypothetical protein
MRKNDRFSLDYHVDCVAVVIGGSRTTCSICASPTWRGAQVGTASLQWVASTGVLSKALVSSCPFLVCAERKRRAKPQLKPVLFEAVTVSNRGLGAVHIRDAGIY